MYCDPLARRALTLFLKEKFMAQVRDISVFSPQSCSLLRFVQTLFFLLQFQMLCINRPLASSSSRLPLFQDQAICLFFLGLCVLYVHSLLIYLLIIPQLAGGSVFFPNYHYRASV